MVILSLTEQAMDSKMYYATRVTTFPNVANAEYSLLATMHVDPNFVDSFQNHWQMLPQDLIFSIAFYLGVCSGNNVRNRTRSCMSLLLERSLLSTQRSDPFLVI